MAAFASVARADVTARPDPTSNRRAPRCIHACTRPHVCVCVCALLPSWHARFSWHGCFVSVHLPIWPPRPRSQGGMCLCGVCAAFEQCLTCGEPVLPDNLSSIADALQSLACVSSSVTAGPEVGGGTSSDAGGQLIHNCKPQWGAMPRHPRRDGQERQTKRDPEKLEMSCARSS